MLNKSGTIKTNYKSVRQILANVEMQVAVGCIVPQVLGVAVGTKKIAKAGTPVHIDLENRNTAVKATSAGTSGDESVTAPAVNMNAVLLHDVDVTAGNANGTALIFGFVDLTKVESDVAIKIATAKAHGTPSALLTFIK